MKYAIIETGGKQYKVEEDKTILIERTGASKGDEIVFDKVLFYSNGDQKMVGRPYLEEIKVIGEVDDEVKGRKVIVYKYKPKKRYRRKLGHRQVYVKATIKEIRCGSEGKEKV
jgi:large subunit ribosomal protein L21